MSSIFAISGRLYGTPKTNIRRGEPVRGSQPMAAFTVGEYNSFRKEMNYYRCVAFGKTAERIVRWYTPKRAVQVTGRLGNNTFKKQGEEKEFRSVQFICTGIDFPESAEGVPSISQSYKNDLDNHANTAEPDAEADRYMEDHPGPGSVPDDPDDLPF